MNKRHEAIKKAKVGSDEKSWPKWQRDFSKKVGGKEKFEKEHHASWQKAKS